MLQQLSVGLNNHGSTKSWKDSLSRLGEEGTVYLQDVEDKCWTRSNKVWKSWGGGNDWERGFLDWLAIFRKSRDLLGQHVASIIRQWFIKQGVGYELLCKIPGVPLQSFSSNLRDLFVYLTEFLQAGVEVEVIACCFEERGERNQDSK